MITKRVLKNISLSKEFVLDEFRDKIISEIRKSPKNNLCFDCRSRYPTWFSATFGIFLCLVCSGKHRSHGSNVSFVRSTELDSLTAKELLRLELGGNENAEKFFMNEGQQIDYQSPKAEEYRLILDQKVQSFLKEKITNNDIFNSTDNDTQKDNNNSLDNLNVKISEAKQSDQINTHKLNTNENLSDKKFDFDFDSAFNDALKSNNQEENEIPYRSSNSIYAHKIDLKNESYNNNICGDNNFETNTDLTNQNWLNDIVSTRLSIAKETAIHHTSNIISMASKVMSNAANYLKNNDDQEF